ncbi:MAG: glycosyltransferase family 2 protein [Bacteroidia bacterium]
MKNSNHKPLLSIIVVSYNCCELLHNCLFSLRPYLQADRDELIVVDNASTDESVSMLERLFPEVKLLASGSNLGFGRANILGLQEARGDYVFLLNPDTVVHGDVLQALLDFFNDDAHKEVGVAGFQLLDSAGRPDISAGNFPSLIQLVLELFPSRLFPYRLQSRLVKDYIEVDYVSGADLAFPRKLWEETGGFDPSFFLYYEETEWQYRVMKAGYKRVLIQGPSITHYSTSDLYKLHPLKIRIFESSRILYYQKVYGRLAAWYARFALSLYYGSRFLMGKSSHFARSAREVWYV